MQQSASAVLFQASIGGGGSHTVHGGWWAFGIRREGVPLHFEISPNRNQLSASVVMRSHSEAGRAGRGKGSKAPAAISAQTRLGLCGRRLKKTKRWPSGKNSLTQSSCICNECNDSEIQCI